MSDDFYVASWAHRMAALEVERAEATTELKRAKANGDYSTAGIWIEQIAEVDAKVTNLANIHHQYQASQMPAQAPNTRGDVDLTPNEAAKICGVDADTYNRGVHRLLTLKAAGNYGER